MYTLTEEAETPTEARATNYASLTTTPAEYLTPGMQGCSVYAMAARPYESPRSDRDVQCYEGSVEYAEIK